jgi:cytochrome c553
MNSSLLLIGWVLLLPVPFQAAVLNEPIEFFERRVRPILTEKCLTCHGAQLAIMGGLRLDSRAALLKGGDRGPAIVPHSPEKSLLIRAVSYQDLQLKMPPTGKLSEQEIADLVAWVKMGAPDPRSESAPTADWKPGIDFQNGRSFWAFKTIQKPVPPQVRQENWIRSPIDRFVLARLEEKNLEPALPTDKYSWLRRVTFDLIGLPPTPQEIEAFLADGSSDAQQRVVERLLSSPHYGERWGRHWLDLVRFAETNGHEFDNDKLDAWRYRDYVIRAFNQDLSYNEFVREHIAGDLLPAKRQSADGTFFESPLGTSFLWFGEVLNSATDSVKSRADEVDNQIDVLTKAFLGLTGACARCHDHKFDPIPTSDYYALAGFLHSTNVSETIVDAPSRVRQIAVLRDKIADVNQKIRELLKPQEAVEAQRLKKYLLDATEAWPTEAAKETDKAKDLPTSLPEVWNARLKSARKEPEDVFYPFAAIAEALLSKAGSAETASTSSDAFQKALAEVRHELKLSAAKASWNSPDHRARGEVLHEDFETENFEEWKVAGQAFGSGPVHALPPNQGIWNYQGQGLANSFAGGSDRLVGSLTSKKFKLPKLFVHVRMGGSAEKATAERAGLRFTVVADGHKSLHLYPNGNGGLQWMTLRLTKEIGRVGYFEIVDRSTNGHIVVDQIVLSDSKAPPKNTRQPATEILSLLSQTDLQSLGSLAEAYQSLLLRLLKHDSPSNRLLPALSATGKLEDVVVRSPSEPIRSLAGVSSSEALKQLQDERLAFEQAIPESAFAMVAEDENPHDVRVHIRGNHKNLGEVAPRRFLQVVAGEGQPPVPHGSGRLQLAEWMVNPGNPLTARVMVNRIWKHHFGQGIVRSTDNFGKNGDGPTHPELLDFMASHFIASGWSVKAMHRMMLLSNTYAMSGQADPAAAKTDPENKLLHHMPVRRLEAEAIRDSILAVSGTLNRTLFGPSVPPHISAYQDGRGKPQSGPLDGQGRRSIYIQVRRNFLTPMFIAFDYPLPISAIGNRSASTVPSQALIMMNNEFVASQAEAWASRLRTETLNVEDRARRMFSQAFGRPARENEVQVVLRFAESQRARYAEAGSIENQIEQQVWTDVAHVLFNSAEFIYIR